MLWEFGTNSVQGRKTDGRITAALKTKGLALRLGYCCTVRLSWGFAGRCGPKVQLRERKNGFLVPKRHRMKHLDFFSFLLESRRSSRFFHWTIANDNVLYHSLLRLTSPQQVWGSLSEMGTICSSGLPTRNAPKDVPGPWRVCRYQFDGRTDNFLLARHL